MLFVQSVLASEFMFSSETVIGLVDTVWVGSVGTVLHDWCVLSV